MIFGISQLVWTIIAIVNAIFGICLFEWAWHKTRRLRKPIHELNAQFPELNRLEAKDYARWKFYPCVITLLIPRFIIAFGTFFFMGFICCIIMIGQNRDKPVNRLRMFIYKATVQGFVWVFSTMGFFTFYKIEHVSPERVNNYEEYLGPISEQRNYQKESTEAHPSIPKRGNGPSSTMICNHSGFLEVLNLLVCLWPSFTPKIGIKRAPIISDVCKVTQSMYIDRGSSAEGLQKVIETFIER